MSPQQHLNRRMRKTNQNGKAKTRITFGPKAGDLRIYVRVTPVQLGFEVDSGSYALNIERHGTGNGTHGLPGLSEKFTFTFGDTNKKLPSGFQLHMSVDPASSATGTFNPAVINIDKNGKAETKLTYGLKGGVLTIVGKRVRSRPKDRQDTTGPNDSADEDQQLTIDYSVLGDVGITEDKSYRKNISTLDLRGNPRLKHKLAFRLTDSAGRGRSGLPVVFSIHRGYLNGVKTLADASFAGKNKVAVTTNSEGVAQTNVTFKKKPGNLNIDVVFQLQKLTRINCVFYPDNSVVSATFPDAFVVNNFSKPAGSNTFQVRAAASKWDTFGLGGKNTLTSNKQYAVFYARVNTRYRLVFYANKGEDIS